MTVNSALLSIAKLMVVGEGGAGKSSTVRTLLGQPFNPDWDSTIGANLIQAKAKKKEWREADKGRDYVVDAAVKLANLDKSARRSQGRSRSKQKMNPYLRRKKRWPLFRKGRREEAKRRAPAVQEKGQMSGLIARQGSTVIMDRAEIVGKFDVNVLDQVSDSK